MTVTYRRWRNGLFIIQIQHKEADVKMMSGGIYRYLYTEHLAVNNYLVDGD